ncbi:hypothetical protein ACRE_078710 [Hapsidospora chrysogenum ATCC 11550]|uniref:LysM domain-containing protein n=1 Tax=Hapsidospora chrysogenum (strain ATCC 11550 / CBS 779.69 / DSM 880 / IAM 14645 / JCM 23072 / IMI 49137) TaxID=857340 RepID=A0A086SWD3_HAPC1|nr:hypothetical protein ACRE_078710 [Hapsidospora chrysogenum ATCC 11550]
MTDRSRTNLARSSSHISSSSHATPASDPPSASSSIRPRNRRLISTGDPHNDHHDSTTERSSGLLSAFSPATSRVASPLSASRSAGVSPSRAPTSDIGQFLSDSWTQSWSSVQGLTSSLLSNMSAQDKMGARSKQGSRGRRLSPSGDRRASASWGPAPPAQRPGLDDVAAGSWAKRQEALKAARTASVLESHDGVNGGLDVSGRHKRRTSDEVTVERNRDNDYLVYIHHVQPEDTFVGIVLRYKCREDVFRRANGLWSRDSIQTRKWVTIPVDACDIRGRPCNPPSGKSPYEVDLLAPTPNAEEDDSKRQEATHGDFFSKPTDEPAAPTEQVEEDKPWTHVRWVMIDSIKDPVEIGRVPRGAMGYFPPRRRKSIRTISSLSTPRQSFDLPSATPGSVDGPSTRRPSSLSSSRPQFSGTPTSSRSRMGSDSADGIPAWMKRPGGVGSMGRNARAPGPDKDIFNTWTRKHIPGLNIDLPSMSIMGSETAHFGFRSDPNLVESSYEEGRDATAPNRQGTGLDRAAAAVETWLRGALAKHPGTPSRGGGDRGGADSAGDLIELADTGSDDGRPAGNHSAAWNAPGESSGRGDASATARGRMMAGMAKGGKAD